MGFNETNYGETPLLNELESGGDLDLGEYDVYADNIRSLTQNALKNSLRLTINQDMVFHQLTDGAIDEFQDETGIGTAEGVSHSTGKYTFDFSLIERAISAISADREYDIYVASRLIDENLTTEWVANLTDDTWIKIDLGSSQIARILAYHCYATYCNADTIPDTITISGSNDDSDYTVLDTLTDLSISETDWNYLEFSNSTPYRYYKITLSGANNSYRVSEIKLFDYVSGGAYLESVAISAGESPAYISAAVCWVGTVYEGLDLYISVDGVYEKMTLDQASEILSGTWMLSYSIAPTTPGSSIRWKLVSSIEGDVQGVGVCW